METLYLTDLDQRRLELLLDVEQRNENMQHYVEMLRELLDTAVTMPSERIPPDVVTMNSVVRYEDELSHGMGEITLVYPADADPANGMVSILSPFGNALLGLRVGETGLLRLPSGEQRRIKVLAVLYQPEASGMLTT